MNPCHRYFCALKRTFQSGKKCRDRCSSPLQGSVDLSEQRAQTEGQINRHKVLMHTYTRGRA